MATRTPDRPSARKSAHPARKPAARTRNKVMAASARLVAEKPSDGTPIQQCIKHELMRYLELLEGQEPGDLHALVMEQCEQAVVEFTLQHTRGNKSRAAKWLGISRGKLRGLVPEPAE